MTATRKSFRKSTLALAAASVLGPWAAGSAEAAGCTLPGATTWAVAGNADWTSAASWNPATVPNSLATDVCITNGTSTVTLSTTQQAGNLQIGSGNGLNITSGNLVIGGTSLINDGVITNSSFMQLANNVTLSGAGVMTLAGGQIGTNGNAYTFTNQSTIQGSGVIGSNSGPLYPTVGFSNSGTVNANSSGNVLSIQGNGGSVTNTGLLQASGGGILTLAPSGAVVNAGGTITANGGTVNLSFVGGQMVQGGTLTTSNGGVMQTAGTAGLDGATHGAITISNGSTYTAGATGSGTQTFVVGAINLGTGLGSTLALGGALELAGDTSLSGAGGVVQMNAGQIGTNGNLYTLTNNTTIQGSGLIGSNSTTYPYLNLTNTGVINANTAGQTLSIGGNGGSFVNTGLLEATNGATLVLGTQAQLVNTGGSIVANGVGSLVNLQGQYISGGTLTTANGGVVQAITGVTLDGANATNGAVTISNGSTYTAGAAGSGTQTFVTGAIKLGTGAGSTISLGGALALVGDTTLSGAGGVVQMNAGQIGTNGNLYTLFNNVTIQGSGTIGSNGTTYQNLNLTNNSVINANVSGQALSIQGNGNSIVNNGVMEATGGGTLNLNTSAPINNSTGSIVASGAGNTVNLTNQTVQGGVLTATNGAVMQTIGNVTLDASTLGAITFSNGSTYLAGAGGTGTQTFVVGALKLGTGSGAGAGSTISLGGALELIGDTTLSGAGGVVQMNAGQIGTNGNLYTLFNNVTIQGSGTIGSNGTTYQNLNLTNNSVINANVSGQALSIQGNGNSIVNNGLMEATNGSTLILNTATPINNSTGSIVASGAGNTVNLTNQTVQGGVLTATNGAVMQTIGSATLDASTLGAITFSNGSTYTAGAAGTGTPTFVIGTLNLGTGAGSTISLGGALDLIGDTTLSGAGGVVQMNAGQIGTNGNLYTLTNNVTIQGSGTIGSNGTTYQNLNLANNGVINASVSGGTLSIQGTGSSIVNNGLMEATGGGTLNLNTSAPINNSTGSIVANGTGNTVNLTNQTVQGGVLTATNGAVMQTAGSATLDGSTLGAITISNGSTYTAGGANSGTPTFTLGAINLGSGSLPGAGSTIALGGALELVGDTTLSGTGGVVQMNAGQIGTNGNAYTLTNNATIQGSGVIGSNATTYQNLNVANNGVINANTSGQILSVQETGALTGTGTLQTSGGTLNLALNGPSTQGQLVMGGSGSALTINTQNLTITTDYTNAQSGSGNAFDRRAGITGTGLILAGGNAAQVINGAGVTGGSTSNATLTLNNVHVGTTTFNYQVADVGTSGPALRGAIQTNVNGANLTDSRLSGSGVTASNYNTGAPGSNTGNLAVAFTTATAGALAPLSGQVLNLTSNFDNIADQKLNIVLGSGAAAYNLANGSAGSPVTIANQRIGGSNSATLAIANVAAAGSFSEDLNASVTGTSGAITSIGSVAGRLAGTSNTGTGAITVGLDTSSAGAKTGTVNLGYVSTGTVSGVSNGLGTTSVGTQAVTVNGGVYQAATGALQTTALNFGTVQVGQTVGQVLTIRNTATGAAGFVEDLNASFGAAAGTGASLITGSGSLSGILAGTNSTAANGTMTVSVNTSAAGTVSGGIAVNYATAGAVAGVSNGLGTASAGSQSFGVAGTITAAANVINQASPLVNTPTIALAARRVGDAAATSNVSVTNVATTAPQAALNASISSNGLPVTASGSFSLLNPGATSSNQLSVGLSTATAGDFTGANARSATIALVSDASNVGGCAPNCQLTLASQQVSVSGKVYTAATAQVNTPAVNFGIVHVGDNVATKGVAVTNSAGLSGLNDVLVGSIGGASAGFTASGTLSNLAAQSSSPGSFQVGLTTANAGIFSGTATTSFASHNADMTDMTLGSQTIALSGQVNNYAQASVNKVTGAAALSQSGHTYTLDFGTLLLGSAGLTDTLSILNSASGLADLLAGSFDTSGAGAEFALGGFSSFSGVAAGFSQGGLTVTFESGLLGSFNDTIVLHAAGSNASGYNGALSDTTLFLRGNVVSVAAVPEPATNALLLIGLLAVVGAAKRARSARSAA